MSEEKPTRQAISPISGVAPPVATRFKKGQSGNAGGSSTAGAITRNYMNRMARRNLRESKLRAIIADKSKPDLMRSAAEKILHSRTHTNLAAFDPWIKGEMTLSQLEAEGVDISVVKSASITKEGRRIELYDKAGENFDRIVEHTDGRPSQTKDINVNVFLRTPDARADAGNEASARLRSLFGSATN